MTKSDPLNGNFTVHLDTLTISSQIICLKCECVAISSNHCLERQMIVCVVSFFGAN